MITQNCTNHEFWERAREKEVPFQAAGNRFKEIVLKNKSCKEKAKETREVFLYPE